MKFLKSFILFEVRNQLTLPFKEKEFSGKSIHEHLEDALLDLKTMEVKKYKSTKNLRDEIDVADEICLKELIDENELEEGYMAGFIYKYPPINTEEETKDLDNWKRAILNSEELEGEKEGIEQVDAIIRFLRSSQEYNYLKDLLTKKGKIALAEYLEEAMEENLTEMKSTIWDSYNDNDKQFIDVWRCVEYSPDGDVYLDIKKYGGVGQYWSWDEHTAQSYWGEGGNKHEIILHGKVAIQCVDWVKTVKKNSGDFIDEKEIQVIDNESIMIVGFFDKEIKKEHIFEEPYVVSVGDKDSTSLG